MRKSPTRFSVVLPTLNRPTRLKSAVESILEQSFSQFELWIVDDGSTSETATVCEALTADQRVRILRNPSPLGAAAARNRGARNAEGEFLCFIDDDCVWHPERLERIDGALRESHPEPGYVCTQTVVIHGGPPVTFELAPVLTGGEAPWRVGTHMMTVSRDDFARVGGFDERLPRGHDWDLALRLVEVTRWRLIEEPLAWADHPRGLSHDPEKMERASRILAKKHGLNSPVSAQLAAEFHTAFGNKLLAAEHGIEGLRHFGIAVALAPARLRNWLYLGAALLGPAAYRVLARLAQKVAGGPLRRPREP
jgi:glycosyltransferase involved in cell wall biosynthesis